MAAYLIAQVKLTDDSWIPDYAAKVHDIAAKHGGRYLSRSASITELEGTPPDVDVIAVIEFPSVSAAQDFAADPDYAPYADARKGGSISTLFVIDDKDATGGIPYLPSGAAA